MKLFSPELWPQKIQIRSAKQQICPFHWPFIIRKWRQKGCRLPTKKKVSSFSADDGSPHVQLQPRPVFCSLTGSSCPSWNPFGFVGNPSQFFQSLLPRFKIYIPCVWCCSLHFDSSNSFLRVKTGFEDGSIPMFDSQITWNHLFLCFNPNLLMVTSAFFMVKSHVLMILMVRSNF